MSVVIRFNTDFFNVKRERPNPINPIFAESLLLWLGHALEPGHKLSQPEPEDWGWFSDLVWQGQSIMLGASAAEDEDGEREWVLQVVPQRTLKQRLLGAGKVTQDHPLVARLLKALSSEPAFKGVSVESSA